MTSFNSCDSGVAQQVDGSTLDVTKGPLSREFGFIPNKEPCILKLYKGQEIKFCNASHWLCNMHKVVKNTRTPNYQEAYIVVPSLLQVRACRQLTKKNLDFKILAEHVEFGFPLVWIMIFLSLSYLQKNHASALIRPQGVDKHFGTEIAKKSIYGPFEKSPFDQTHYSYLMARDKPEGAFESLLTFHGL